MSGTLTDWEDHPDFKNLVTKRFQHISLPSGLDAIGLVTETGFGTHKTVILDDGQACIFETQEIIDLDSPDKNSRPKRCKYDRKLYSFLLAELQLREHLQIATQGVMDSQTAEILDGVSYFLLLQSADGPLIQRCYINPQYSSRPEIRSLSKSLEKLFLLNSFDLWWLLLRKSLF